MNKTWESGEEPATVLEILRNAGRLRDTNYVLNALENAGGYSAVADDEKLWDQHGDLIDPLVHQRAIDVRNALRELGWEDDGSRPMMGGPLRWRNNPEYVLQPVFRGTRTNAITCSYTVKGMTGYFMSDRWTLPADEVARLLHRDVVAWHEKHSEKRFDTHVYATIRVKVLGTNGDDPQKVADKIANAVAADTDQWFRPEHGKVHVSDGESYDIGEVEYADEVSWVLVDEKIEDEEGYESCRQHHFDHRLEPVEFGHGDKTAMELRLQREVDKLKAALAALGGAIEEGGPEDIAHAWLSASNKFGIEAAGDPDDSPPSEIRERC